VDIFARKHATRLLIRALDERMCLCILKFKTPYDKTAPATPNHNVSTLLNTTCDAAEEIQGPESPEEKVYILDIYLPLFCLEQHYVYSKSSHTGDKRSHLLENTHLPLRCGNVNVYFLQTWTS